MLYLVCNTLSLFMRCLQQDPGLCGPFKVSREALPRNARHGAKCLANSHSPAIHGEHRRGSRILTPECLITQEMIVAVRH
jgi:hypothetical protein